MVFHALNFYILHVKMLSAMKAVEKGKKAVDSRVRTCAGEAQQISSLSP